MPLYAYRGTTLWKKTKKIQTVGTSIVRTVVGACCGCLAQIPACITTKRNKSPELVHGWTCRPIEKSENTKARTGEYTFQIKWKVYCVPWSFKVDLIFVKKNMFWGDLPDISSNLYTLALAMGPNDIDICSDIHISIYISRYMRMPAKDQYMRISGNIWVLFRYIDISRYIAVYNATYIAPCNDT